MIDWFFIYLQLQILYRRWHWIGKLILSIWYRKAWNGIDISSDNVRCSSAISKHRTCVLMVSRMTLTHAPFHPFLPRKYPFMLGNADGEYRNAYPYSSIHLQHLIQSDPLYIRLRSLSSPTQSSHGEQRRSRIQFSYRE